MSLRQCLQDAVIDLVEDHDIPEVNNPDSTPTHSPSSADVQTPSQRHCSPDRERDETAARIEPQHSDATQAPESKDASAREVTISENSDLELSDNTDLKEQKDELQHESSKVLVEKVSPKVNTHRTDQGLSGHNQKLLQNEVLHLRWQDRASMAIKEMKEEAAVRKHEARAAKKAAVRARSAMQRQIDDFKCQVASSERDKERVLEEKMCATEDELEAQKKATEQAAAAAERQITEAQTKHNEDMSTADAKIKELRAAQTFTFNSNWEAKELREQLAQEKKEKAKDLAAKDEEIKNLQSCNDDSNSEICRLQAKAENDRVANNEATRKGLERVKRATDREAKELKEEIENLVSRREEAESRASRAEGCAKGLQDQLRATKKRAEHREMLCTKAEEDARNEVLSAYNVVPAQVSEGDRQITTTSSKEEELLVLVEELRKENGVLQRKTECLTNDIVEWRRVWEKAIKDHEAWEEAIHRWEVDVRRQYEEEKREALAAERAKGRVPNGQDAREQDVRRQCEEEKQKALAMEREKSRVEIEALRGQFAMKLKSHTNREPQKLRGRAVESKKQMKVKKCQLKWVFNRAVSHAVDVERSLLQTQFQTQFQTELLDYKTRIEPEKANPQTQSVLQNDAGSTDQVLQHEEIKKRDGFIEKQKEYLTKAFEDKRQTESEKQDLEKDLQNVRAENNRLSRDVIAYESEKAMAKQTKSEAQITLMAQELVRALKLFTEIAILGLDEKHRNLLNELLLANKVVRDMKTTIEEGASVDNEDYQVQVDRVFVSSDEFDDLDPKERPALHAQLLDTYTTMGVLNNILKGKPGDTLNQEILDCIYRDVVKGKEKEGAIVGTVVASGPSFNPNGGVSAAARPFATTPKPNAAESQDGPGYTESATAHDFQANDEWNQVKAPAAQAVNINEPSEGSKELEDILTKLRNSVAANSSQDVPQEQPYPQRLQPHTQAHQSPLPGPFSQHGQVHTSEEPAGWTDMMTGWVRYLLQQGTDLNGIETGMRSSFSTINNMVGVKQHLEKIMMEWEGQQVQMQQG